MSITTGSLIDMYLANVASGMSADVAKAAAEAQIQAIGQAIAAEERRKELAAKCTEYWKTGGTGDFQEIGGVVGSGVLIENGGSNPIYKPKGNEKPKVCHTDRLVVTPISPPRTVKRGEKSYTQVFPSTLVVCQIGRAPYQIGMNDCVTLSTVDPARLTAAVKAVVDAIPAYRTQASACKEAGIAGRS